MVLCKYSENSLNKLERRESYEKKPAFDTEISALNKVC